MGADLSKAARHREASDTGDGNSVVEAARTAPKPAPTRGGGARGGGARRGRLSLPRLTIEIEVALTVFLAGAPLAALVALELQAYEIPARIFILSLTAVFAGIVATALAVQILSFVQAMLTAAERWRDGDLEYQITDSRSWSAEFSALAESVNGMALQLRQLYQRERRIAVTLQNLLVTPLPSAFGPYRFADFYRAGSPAADIGGDFFTLFPLGGDHIGLIFGDIVGHGLQAATKIAEVRFTLEAYAKEGEAPSELAERVNRLIYTKDDEIVTLVYLAIDLRTGAAWMINAGHEPPLIRHASTGAWTSLGLSQPALGVLPEVQYTAQEISLEVGDLVLLYTDGVASVGPRAGLWRTEDLLSRAAGAPVDPEGLVQYVAEAIPGGEDDASLVALQRTDRVERSEKGPVS